MCNNILIIHINGFLNHLMQASDYGSGIRASLEGLAKSLQSLLPISQNSQDQSLKNDETLFHFLYERRPFSPSKVKILSFNLRGAG